METGHFKQAISFELRLTSFKYSKQYCFITLSQINAGRKDGELRFQRTMKAKHEPCFDHLYKGPRVDFKSGGGTLKLHNFLGLGYTSCIQKILFAEKSGAPMARPLL